MSAAGPPPGWPREGPPSVPAPTGAGERADRLAEVVAAEAEVAALAARLRDPKRRSAAPEGHCGGCETCRPEWRAVAERAGLSVDYVAALVAEAEARVLAKLIDLSRSPANRAERRRRGRAQDKAAERR